ncbi:MAG: response regulator [Patescibacteria group bacterium]|nr:response regulator [Patescibacteria group bacterium]
MSPERASKHILVVDDDIAIREMMEAILSGEGHNVALASGPEEVIEAVVRSEQKKGLINLAFIDLYMPRGVLSGDQVVKFLKSEHPYIQCIVCSSALDVMNPCEISRLRDIGADDLVQKPFDLDEVLRLANGNTGNGCNPK